MGGEWSGWWVGNRGRDGGGVGWGWGVQRQRQPGDRGRDVSWGDVWRGTVVVGQAGGRCGSWGSGGGKGGWGLGGGRALVAGCGGTGVCCGLGVHEGGWGCNECCSASRRTVECRCCLGAAVTAR